MVANWRTRNKQAWEKKVICGSKALNDIEAAYCRMNVKKFTHAELAKKFGVSEKCVKRCVQGMTYKHLDKEFPPMDY